MSSNSNTNTSKRQPTSVEAKRSAHAFFASMAEAAAVVYAARREARIQRQSGAGQA